MGNPEDSSFFCLAPGEPIGACLRRLLLEQLHGAIHRLTNPAESLDQAVHDGRRFMKRARSLLLLAGGTSRHMETQRLRAADQSLSDFRDAQVLIETLARLRRKRPAIAEIPQLAAALRRRKKQAAAALRVDNAIEALQQAAAIAARLPVERVSFGEVAKAVKRTVQRGQTAFASASHHPTAAGFHEARKQAKHLRYELEILTPLWPEVLAGYAAAAKDVEELLGNDHNLAVLADALQPAPESGLADLIAKQQRKLRGRAVLLSRRLYAEPAKAWRKRLEAAWQARGA